MSAGMELRRAQRAETECVRLRAELDEALKELAKLSYQAQVLRAERHDLVWGQDALAKEKLAYTPDGSLVWPPKTRPDGGE